MTKNTRISTRRLPESVRRRLEVATAMGWESLVETHVAQATQFVHLLGEKIPLEEGLARYLLEMDLGDSMAAAVRTRVLVTIEEEAHASDSSSGGDASTEPDDEGWRRFRPDVVVRGVFERQRQQDATEQWVQLALARAEENVITTHVDNAITFAALLEDHLPLDRGVHHYLDAVALTGSRGQAILQRTMARLADVHLPLPASRA